MSKKTKKKFTKLDVDFSHKPISEPWADIEVEKDQSNDYDINQIQQLRQSLPSAPRATRAQQDVERIPMHGPFKAYVGNIPFDATEEDLTLFFRNQTVRSVKFVTSQNKMRGFGYVEFETRDDLIAALAMSDSTFQSRKIKIDLAESNDKHGDADRGNDRGRQDRGNYSNRPPGAAEADSNWRSGGGPPARPDNDRYGQRNNDDFNKDNRGGFERRGFGDRGGDRGFGDRGADRGFGDRGGDRGFSDRGGGGGGFQRRNEDKSDNWRKDGPPPRRDDDNYRPRNEDGFRPRNEDNYRPRNEDNYRPRNEDNYRNRNEEGVRNRNDEDSWRKRDNRPNGGETNEDQKRPDNPVSDEREPPKERPRLQLAPRTKPLDEKRSDNKESSRQSNIFGDAKPVNTLMKELEIENKLEKEKEEIIQKADTNQSSSYPRGSNPSSANPPKHSSALSPTGGSGRTHLDSQGSSSSGHSRQRLSSGGVTSSREHRISENSSITEESNLNNNQSNVTGSGSVTSSKKECSEDGESVKLVPAPLPAVNVWSKRKENVPAADNKPSNNSNSSSVQSRPHPEAQASVSAKPPPQKVATVSVAKAFQPQQANAWARGPPRGSQASGESIDSANNDSNQISNPPPNAWTHGDSSRLK